MFVLRLSSHFLRKSKKYRKKNPALRPVIEKTLRSLKEDPYAPPLGTHRVIAAYDGKPALSSRLTNDLRIIWREDQSEPIILDLLDLGGHSGGGKVYR